jgi:hypothetical protein
MHARKRCGGRSLRSGARENRRRAMESGAVRPLQLDLMVDPEARVRHGGQGRIRPPLSLGSCEGRAAAIRIGRRYPNPWQTRLTHITAGGGASAGRARPTRETPGHPGWRASPARLIYRVTFAG